MYERWSELADGSRPAVESKVYLHLAAAYDRTYVPG